MLNIVKLKPPMQPLNFFLQKFPFLGWGGGGGLKVKRIRGCIGGFAKTKLFQVGILVRVFFCLLSLLQSFWLFFSKALLSLLIN